MVCCDFIGEKKRKMAGRAVILSGEKKRLMECLAVNLSGEKTAT